MPDITAVFIELYDAEVKAAYQREGSMLRQTMRVRAPVPGQTLHFPLIGKGQATSKGRNALVTPMNLDYDSVPVTFQDRYAPQYLDELDLEKINWSVRTETAQAAAWAIGRDVDDMVINAALLSGNTVSAATLNPGGGPELSLPVITGVSRLLNERDVPPDRRRWAIITPESLDELLQVDQATSTFYIREQILISGQEPTFWMGFNWIVHTGLPPGIKGLFWHHWAMGLGFNADIRSRIDWIAERVSWLVNSYASYGSVIVDDDGVQILTP